MEGLLVRLKDSSTRVSLVLTCCPPGPVARLKRSRSSLGGMVRVRVMGRG